MESVNDENGLLEERRTMYYCNVRNNLTLGRLKITYVCLKRVCGSSLLVLLK